MKKAIYIVPLILASLMGIFSHQVAYGTNEGSYKFGYCFGYNDYKCATSEDCDFPSSDVSDTCAVGAWHGPMTIPALKGLAMTNSTACADGYVV